jgi:hypothetical protein
MKINFSEWLNRRAEPKKNFKNHFYGRKAGPGFSGFIFSGGGIIPNRSIGLFPLAKSYRNAHVEVIPCYSRI